MPFSFLKGMNVKPRTLEVGSRISNPASTELRSITEPPAVFAQPPAQSELVRLPPPQSLHHVAFDCCEVIGQANGISGCFGCTRRRVGPRNECRIPGQAYSPEGHLRNGEIMDCLNERLLGRHHEPEEKRRQSTLGLIVQPTEHVGSNLPLRNGKLQPSPVLV